MESVLEYITLYAPVIIAVLGEIGVVAAMITKITSYFKKANAAVDELKQSSEYKELKNQMKVVLEENYMLKTKIDTLVETMTHVKVQNETVKNNKEK